MHELFRATVSSPPSPFRPSSPFNPITALDRPWPRSHAPDLTPKVQSRQCAPRHRQSRACGTRCALPQTTRARRAGPAPARPAACAGSAVPRPRGADGQGLSGGGAGLFDNRLGVSETGTDIEIPQVNTSVNMTLNAYTRRLSPPSSAPSSSPARQTAPRTPRRCTRAQTSAPPGCQPPPCRRDTLPWPQWLSVW